MRMPFRWGMDSISIINGGAIPPIFKRGDNMKDFKTKKSYKKIEELKIDGKDIFLDISSGNIAKAAEFAKKMDKDDATQLLGMSEIMFKKESFELINKLEMQDFIDVINLATEVLSKEEKNISSKFKKVE